MLIEVLEFIFQSFWHFLGSAVLLTLITSIFHGIITINHNYSYEDIIEEEEESNEE